jgi:hypothetical protein
VSCGVRHPFLCGKSNPGVGHEMFLFRTRCCSTIPIYVLMVVEVEYIPGGEMFSQMRKKVDLCKQRHEFTEEL